MLSWRYGNYLWSVAFLTLLDIKWCNILHTAASFIGPVVVVLGCLLIGKLCGLCRPRSPPGQGQLPGSQPVLVVPVNRIRTSESMYYNAEEGCRRKDLLRVVLSLNTITWRIIDFTATDPYHQMSETLDKSLVQNDSSFVAPAIPQPTHPANSNTCTS
jgi:hypothetical protein